MGVTMRGDDGICGKLFSYIHCLAEQVGLADEFSSFQVLQTEIQES